MVNQKFLSFFEGSSRAKRNFDTSDSDEENDLHSTKSLHNKKGIITISYLMFNFISPSFLIARFQFQPKVNPLSANHRRANKKEFAFRMIRQKKTRFRQENVSNDFFKKV